MILTFDRNKSSIDDKLCDNRCAIVDVSVYEVFIQRPKVRSVIFSNACSGCCTTDWFKECRSEGSVDVTHVLEIFIFSVFIFSEKFELDEREFLPDVLSHKSI